MSIVTVTNIAKVCHAANLAFSGTIDDYSGIDWEYTDPDIKKSAEAGVRKVLDNPEITPEQMHAEWSAYKKAEGWVFGETKNVGLKTHPSLVAYGDLTETEKVKDAIFIGVVLGMAGLLSDNGGQ